MPGQRFGFVPPLTGVLLVSALVGAMGSPAAAQEYSLFDSFSIRAGASEMFIGSQVRLDSKTRGIGTTIDFEDDVNLDDSKFISDLELQWRVGRRHNLNFYWSDIDRTSTAQAAREIQFGDLTVPLDGDVLVGFDITTYLAGYTYYPLLRDRVAVGVGLGVRLLELDTALALQLDPGERPPLVVSESADVTGPLPFLGAEVRYAVAPRWRVISSAGIMDLTVDDIGGLQILFNAQIENLVGDHFSWGLAGNVSLVDVDAEDNEFLGTAEIDTAFLSLFVKGRF